MLDLALISTSTTAPHVALYDTAYPGICDPMPQWQVTWNPPDCSTQAHPDVRGMMPPAAWAHAPSTPLVESAAAPVTLAAVAPVEEREAAAAARPAPGHLLLCGQAMVMGAASTVACLASGEASVEQCGEEFRARSIAAASAVSPLGAFVLERDVFGRQ
eukprot:CAMPEP_0173378914 /NCGR_PEP_ID=MMETSP1356-20130122/2022_1 /TAXON_ID=77927 ORGANISM="Hemiselmis virescens, Strain PCC157" /NCGR_SAMPLE_ID=MMETSP1356 /ASSEMBLY_ACC=CAM_ASM_000847 /LENGTH=158 /DNA_ID=CAMNT_0014332145 /DNA_START=39 /DNA_END=515 /DNA_ORIENTATION=+